MTCRQFTQESSEDDILFIMFWIDGYLSHMTGITEIDPEIISSNIDVLMDYCYDRPDMTILEAVHNLIQ